MDMNIIFQENMCLTDPNHYKHSKMTIFDHAITQESIGTVFGGVQPWESAIALILNIIKHILTSNKKSTICFFMKFAVWRLNALVHSVKVSNQGAVYFSNALYHNCAFKNKDIWVFVCLFVLFVCMFVCLFVYFFFILSPYSEETLSIPLFFHMAQLPNTTSKLHYQ